MHFISNHNRYSTSWEGCSFAVWRIYLLFLPTVCLLLFSVLPVTADNYCSIKSGQNILDAAALQELITDGPDKTPINIIIGSNIKIGTPITIPENKIVCLFMQEGSRIRRENMISETNLIEIEPGAELTIDGSGIIGGLGPVSIHDPTQRSLGRAIYNAGKLILTGTIKIQYNNFVSQDKHTDYDEDSLHIKDLKGGGIYNTGNLTIYGGFIQNNSARYGGAIYNDGGTVHAESKVEKISITNNRALGEQNPNPVDHIYSMGGAVYNKGGTVIMYGTGDSANHTCAESVEISSNSTQAYYQLGLGRIRGQGGAIYNEGGRLELYGVSVTKNQASSGAAIAGDGTIVLDDNHDDEENNGNLCMITENKSSQYEAKDTNPPSGGILLKGGSLTIAHSRITFNSAQPDPNYYTKPVGVGIHVENGDLTINGNVGIDHNKLDDITQNVDPYQVYYGADGSHTAQLNGLYSDNDTDFYYRSSITPFTDSSLYNKLIPALWLGDKSVFNIRFLLEPQVGADPNYYYAPYNGSSISTPVSAPPGFTFAGASTGPNASDPIVIKKDGTFASDKTDFTEGGKWIGTITAPNKLYASFYANITLDANDGSSAKPFARATYNATALEYSDKATGDWGTFTAPTTTLPGYAFSGYYTATDDTGVKVISETGGLLPSVTGYTDAAGKWIRQTSPTTLYAKWSTKVVTVGNISLADPIYAGVKFSASYPVTTVGIADGKSGTITWYTAASGGSATTAAPGITLTPGSLSSGSMSLSIAGTDQTVTGTYYFTLTIDGNESERKTLIIEEFHGLLELTDMWGAALTGGAFTSEPAGLLTAGANPNQWTFSAPNEEYTITQTATAAGYAKVLPFRIKLENGQLRLTDDPNHNLVTISGTTISIRNKPDGAADGPELIAKNPYGIGVPGLFFTIEDLQNTNSVTLQTGTDGAQQLPAFSSGVNYRISLTAYPAGFKGGIASFTLTLSPDGKSLLAVGNLPSQVRLDGMDINIALEAKTRLAIRTPDHNPLQGVSLKIRVTARTDGNMLEAEPISAMLLDALISQEYTLAANLGPAQNEVHSELFTPDFEYIVTPSDLAGYLNPGQFTLRLKRDGSGFLAVTNNQYVYPDPADAMQLIIEYRKQSSPGGPDGPGGGNEPQPLPEDDIGAYYYEDGVRKYAWYHRKLPATGFAPARTTQLRPLAQPYGLKTAEVRLSIPALYVDTQVLGVPNSEQGYDISWLGNSVGWLQDTPFPGRLDAGNSVLTGHVMNAEGKPGIFVALERLKYGDMIRVEAFGERYTYRVEDVMVVYADTPQVLSQDRQRSELTLLTCKYWNEESGEYDGRVVVKSVLDNISAVEP